MTDNPAALPSQASENLQSSIRAMLLMGAAGEALKGANWLVAHGVIENSDAAQFVALGSSALVAAGTLGWSFLRNKLNAMKLNAAAATGDPKADPKDPDVKAQISAAIDNPLSPITAKP